ncbi:MAG TPA: hypothetical protein VLS96_09190 [Nodosilinea sp.]|nr:hypothetical protein [Nodosilinea sp.]
MSTYRRHRMLRSLYLDALYTEDYPFPPEKVRPNAKESAGDHSQAPATGVVTRSSFRPM